MSYRVSFVGVANGSRNPVVIDEELPNLEIAQERFDDELKKATESDMIVWKICLNRTGNYPWKNWKRFAFRLPNECPVLRGM